MSLPVRCLAPAMLAASLASGCATSTAVVVSPEPAILVEPQARVLVLHSPAERGRLFAFLHAASGGRLDALHVRVIAADPSLRRATARAIRAMGVDPRKVREVQGSAGSGVRVVAIRYRAYPPFCPPLLVTGPSVDVNDFEPTLGCSDLANLALQVNDPRDLLGNPAVPPTDGERAAIPVARYRLFQGAPGRAGSGSGNATGGATAP